MELTRWAADDIQIKLPDIQVEDAELSALLQESKSLGAIEKRILETRFALLQKYLEWCLQHTNPRIIFERLVLESLMGERKPIGFGESIDLVEKIYEQEKEEIATFIHAPGTITKLLPTNKIGKKHAETLGKIYLDVSKQVPHKLEEDRNNKTPHNQKDIRKERLTEVIELKLIVFTLWYKQALDLNTVTPLLRDLLFGDPTPEKANANFMNAWKVLEENAEAEFLTERHYIDPFLMPEYHRVIFVDEEKIRPRRLDKTVFEIMKEIQKESEEKQHPLRILEVGPGMYARLAIKNWKKYNRQGKLIYIQKGSTLGLEALVREHDAKNIEIIESDAVDYEYKPNSLDYVVLRNIINNMSREEQQQFFNKLIPAIQQEGAIRIFQHDDAIAAKKRIKELLPTFKISSQIKGHSLDLLAHKP